MPRNDDQRILFISPLNVAYGSWLCENEIRFGRNAERKTNFCVFFLLSASPQSPKFGVRLYRLEFSHSQGQTATQPLALIESVRPSISDMMLRRRERRNGPLGDIHPAFMVR
jgi:hypothetical protein